MTARTHAALESRPYHPGRGFVLRGQRASEFEPGTILIDVYRADRWEVLPPKGRKALLRMRRLSDGREHENHQDEARYITPERLADPATWKLPTNDNVRRTAPTCDRRQGVLL
jgi:hypothetical protein